MKQFGDKTLSDQLEEKKIPVQLKVFCKNYKNDSFDDFNVMINSF